VSYPKHMTLSEKAPPFRYLYGPSLYIEAHYHFSYTFIQYIIYPHGFLSTIPNILDMCDLNRHTNLLTTICKTVNFSLDLLKNIKSATNSSKSAKSANMGSNTDKNRFNLLQNPLNCKKKLQISLKRRS
jgi:hypothetical protein